MPDLTWTIAEVFIKRFAIDRTSDTEPERLDAYGTIKLTSDNNELSTTWIVNKSEDGQLVYEIPWPSWDEIPAISGPEIPEAEPEQLGQFALMQLQSVNWQQAVQQALPQL